MRRLPILLALAPVVGCHHRDAADRGHDTAGHDTEQADTVVVDTVVIDTEPVDTSPVDDTDGCIDPGPRPFHGVDLDGWSVASEPVVRADGTVVVLLVRQGTRADVTVALRTWSPDDGAWSTLDVATAADLVPARAPRHPVTEHDGRLSIVLVADGDTEAPVVIDEQGDGRFVASEVATTDALDATAPLVLLAKDGALALLYSVDTGPSGAPRLAVSERAAGSETWTASRLADHLAPSAGTVVAGRYSTIGGLRVIARDDADRWLSLRRDDKDWIQDDVLDLDDGLLPSTEADGAGTRLDAAEGVLVAWSGGDGDAAATRTVFFSGTTGRFGEVAPVGPPGLLSLTVTAAGDGAVASAPTGEAGVTVAVVAAGHVAAGVATEAARHARSHPLAFTSPCGVPSALVALTDEPTGVVAGDDWKIVPLAP